MRNAGKHLGIRWVVAWGKSAGCSGWWMPTEVQNEQASQVGRRKRGSSGMDCVWRRHGGVGQEVTMNRYCEICGYRLEAGLRFCENCGAPVDPTSGEECAMPEVSGRWFAFFEPGFSDASAVRQAVGASDVDMTCVVFTNLAALQADCGDGYRRLFDALLTYVADQRAMGRCVVLLDASANRVRRLHYGSWQDHVTLLKDAIDLFKEQGGREVTHVFIIGGHEVIPMAVVDNLAMDPDADIDTDLPYATLKTEDPWMSGSSALTPNLHVGRLPAGRGMAADAAVRYLTHATEIQRCGLGDPASFSLTAKVWTDPSQVVAQVIGTSALHTSPVITADTIGHVFDRRANWLFFNLHGSDVAPGWYGQEGEDYPEAVVPSTLLDCDRFNVVSVGACYGARFVRLDPKESILLTALAHRTVIFTGSSRIAFGPVQLPIGLADVHQRAFLEALLLGYSAGEAHNLGRHKVLDDPFLEPTGIKTIIEFNLFGDPMLSMLGLNARGKLRRPTRDVDRLSVTMPDVLSHVRQQVDQLRDSIRRRIDAHIWGKYPSLQGIAPRMDEVRVGPAKQTHQRLVYQKKSPIPNVVIVYADEFGNIAREYVSK